MGKALVRTRTAGGRPVAIDLLEPGEKFALVSWERDGRMCCITLMRVGELAGVVKGTIGPLINGVTQDG